MIYWFSATGNSRYAAQAIRAATGDMCVDLLPLLREGGAQIGAAPAHIQKLCARVCPLKNIVIRDGCPTWNGACTHCTACLNLCPAGAIEYGKKTVGKPRYHNNKTFPETD